jgi:hypothetical protein
LAALAALVFLAATACSPESIETPPWAVGVAGPVVLDEAGIITDWDLIGGPNEELPYQTGIYDHDFGVVSTMTESTELVVVWSAVECQLEPVARVSLRNGGLHIDVTPGPNPIEHSAAMGIGFGFRMTLSQPVGDRVITARLIDPVNQQLFEFPPAPQ